MMRRFNVCKDYLVSNVRAIAGDSAVLPVYLICLTAHQH